MDVKVKNLIKFLLFRVVLVLAVAIAAVFYLIPDRDPLRMTGFVVIAIAFWRITLSIYRHMILPSKNILAYGRWAIGELLYRSLAAEPVIKLTHALVTGSTSGIGKAYADYLAAKGMSLLIISRDPKKLAEQSAELERIGKTHKISVKYLAYDFTNMNQSTRKQFYSDVDSECREMVSISYPPSTVIWAD
jgi:hypothetical protein